MSFNLAVILSESTYSSPDRPVAVFADLLSYPDLDSYDLPSLLHLPKNTLGKILKDELVRGDGMLP